MAKVPTNHKFSHYQLPAILVALLIFTGSSIPAEKFPSLSIFYYDKLIHFALFFVFCFFTHRAVMFQDRIPFLARNHIIVAMLFTVLYGILDEAHQALIPGRSPEVLDLIADSSGAVVCTLVIWLWLKYRSRKEKREGTVF
jgi:VanZ family protein